MYGQVVYPRTEHRTDVSKTSTYGQRLLPLFLTEGKAVPPAVAPRRELDRFPLLVTSSLSISSSSESFTSTGPSTVAVSAFARRFPTALVESPRRGRERVLSAGTSGDSCADAAAAAAAADRVGGFPLPCLFPERRSSAVFDDSPVSSESLSLAGALAPLRADFPPLPPLPEPPPAVHDTAPPDFSTS